MAIAASWLTPAIRATLELAEAKRWTIASIPQIPGVVTQGRDRAEAVKRMKLKHVVITAVARDDIKDGGAAEI